MAQHDYVIDNSTGANVRADINNALLAISSTNSGSSAPSTTYPFQLFANTTTSKLQIRNAGNSAFVDLLGLDGSILLADGSASSPSLAFSDDLDTGIFSQFPNTINFATAGVERLELGTASTIFNEDGADVDFRIEGDTDTSLFKLDAGTDKIGIGVAAPSTKLQVLDDFLVKGSSGDGSVGINIRSGGSAIANQHQIRTGGGSGEQLFIEALGSSSALITKVNGSERMRITKDGHLIVGANDDIHTGEGAEIQSVSTVGAGITLARNDTTVSNGSNIGVIKAFGNDADGTFQECGKIEFQADLNHGTGDKPTAIILSTTKDGASTPTEKFRVKSGGDCELADGNLIFASGHGIDFSANANAGGSSSEVLADYEEGSWTPTSRDGSCTAEKAFYIKIGNMVTLHCKLTSFTDNSTNDQVTITGIPFGVGSAKADVAHGSAMYSNISETNNTTCLLGHARQGFNFFGGDSGAFSQIRYNELNSSSRIDLIATYFTF